MAIKLFQNITQNRPNGYLETIDKGMRAVRSFSRNMSYGKGTREEQIARLAEEIRNADAVVIGAGAENATGTECHGDGPFGWTDVAQKRINPVPCLV